MLAIKPGYRPKVRAAYSTSGKKSPIAPPSGENAIASIPPDKKLDHIGNGT